MRTEELQRSRRGADTRGVSPALQDRLPSHWLMTDGNGKPAPLSAAGYVVHFGRTYRLGVAGQGPPPEVRLVSLPPFLKRQPGSETFRRHGREYRCQTFRVRREGGWASFFKWPYEIRVGDLEVECSPPAGSPGSPASYTCPVVARTRWGVGIVVLLIVGYIAGWLLQQSLNVGTDCWRRGVWPWDALGDWWAALEANPRFWLVPLAIAVLNPVACLATHLYWLWRRSAELEARFCEQYQPHRDPGRPGGYAES
jgi:hypothetical protein